MKITYTSLHGKIRRWWGKADKCESCGKTDGRIEWSNKDHKYNLTRAKWQMLCKPCHTTYDRERFPHKTWNKGDRGLKKWHNIKGLNSGTPWNKGKKTGIVPRSAFKKGAVPWNKNVVIS